MTTYDFSNQTAIVTGGAQWIGGAVTELLAAHGARVAIWDMDAGLAQETAARIGGEALAMKVDISDWENVQAAMAKTVETCVGVEILVDSAALAGMNAPLADYPVDEFRKIIDINLNGNFLVNEAAVPVMQSKGYGRIVNIASVPGKEGNPAAQHRPCASVF